MASKKVTRNHTARKNASNHKKAKETVKHNEQVQEEIILIVTLVISILIFLSYLI